MYSPAAARAGAPELCRTHSTVLSESGVIFASSEKSVGDVRLRQFAKRMIQRDFRDVEGAKAVGFSHGQFGLVVEGRAP